VDLDGDTDTSDLLVHDERAEEPSLAYLLARMHWPDCPEPMGVFRAIEADTYEELLGHQVAAARTRYGEGTLERLFHAGVTWEVK